MNLYKVGVVALAVTIGTEWGNPMLEPPPHVELPELPTLQVMTAEIITTLSGTAATILGANLLTPWDIR